MYIGFDWDDGKDLVNQRKHGTSFDEAKSVFFDEYAIQFFDEEHSCFEDRYIMLGISARARVLVICHSENEAGNLIRIISARKATTKERSIYTEQRL